MNTISIHKATFAPAMGGGADYAPDYGSMIGLRYANVF
jgi:hypothetical protein